VKSVIGIDAEPPDLYQHHMLPYSQPMRVGNDETAPHKPVVDVADTALPCESITISTAGSDQRFADRHSARRSAAMANLPIAWTTRSRRGIVRANRATQERRVSAEEFFWPSPAALSQSQKQQAPRPLIDGSIWPPD
tara:strand:+ start:67956 stop:68366 length:411 start_codon:yes stop_codon:yes gene_type:complete